MTISYLEQYRTFKTKEEMDADVQLHINKHFNELPLNTRKVLMNLSWFSVGHPGACRVKMSTLAEKVGCSLTTVNRSIKRLKDLNIIEIHVGTKGNGIQGANIYSILNFSHEETELMLEQEVAELSSHEEPTDSKVQEAKTKSESINSFKQSLKFVNKNVVTYNACDNSYDLKSTLKDIFKPATNEQEKTFGELCKIGYGRLKQYMSSHQVPYLQMFDIVVKAMNDLVRKSNVRNVFAMFSKMIERQTMQLFEEVIKPVRKTASVVKRNKEMIPDWFENRNDKVEEVKEEFDFEAARLQILGKLGN